METSSFFSLTLNELEDKLVSLGVKKFYGKIIYKWVYKKFVINFDEMTDLSAANIKILKENFRFNNFEIHSRLIDEGDETNKFLFILEDKQKIESVLMKFDYGYSVCVSSQVGCNMGCKFCASGLLKKVRDLTTDEIVLQYYTVNKILFEEKKERISNLVMMGIGEPFDNYTNVSKALKILNDPFGIELGARHITVSTSGIINKIIQFGKDFPQMNLAVSLHASNNKTRSSLMPVNNAFNLEKLISTLEEYSKIVNRKITFEYLLLQNVNDSVEQAKELYELIKHLNCYINLINYNSVDEHSFKQSTHSSEFANYLISKGINVTTRLPRGRNIDAACGQLRAKYENKL